MVLAAGCAAAAPTMRAEPVTVEERTVVAEPVGAPPEPAELLSLDGVRGQLPR